MVEIEIGGTELGKLGENLSPQIRNDALTHPVDEIETRRARDCDDEADADERQEVIVDQC